MNTEFKFLPEDVSLHSIILEDNEINYKRSRKIRKSNFILTLFMLGALLFLTNFPIPSISINQYFHITPLVMHIAFNIMLVVHIVFTIKCLWVLRNANIDYLFNRAIYNVCKQEHLDLYHK